MTRTRPRPSRTETSTTKQMLKSMAASSPQGKGMRCTASQSAGRTQRVPTWMAWSSSPGSLPSAPMRLARRLWRWCFCNAKEASLSRHVVGLAIPKHFCRIHRWTTPAFHLAHNTPCISYLAIIKAAAYQSLSARASERERERERKRGREREGEKGREEAL